jgi:hypothetical protein
MGFQSAKIEQGFHHAAQAMTFVMKKLVILNPVGLAGDAAAHEKLGKLA